MKPLVSTVAAMLGVCGVTLLPTMAKAAVTSVSLSDGTLTIVCDSANDIVTFQQWGGTTGQPATYNTRVDTGNNNWDLLKFWSGMNGVPVNGNGIISGVLKVVIKGGNGNDTLGVNSSTPVGTVIELYGEGGDDTLSGGHNTDELLVGGRGNDTIRGNNGQDTIHGDDIPMFVALNTADEPSDNATFASMDVDGFTLTGFRHTNGSLNHQGKVMVNATSGNGDNSKGIGVNTNNPNGDGSSWGSGTRALDNQGYDEMLRIELPGDTVASAGCLTVNLRALGTAGANLQVKLKNGETVVGTKTFSGLGAGNTKADNVKLPFASDDQPFDTIELYVLDLDEADGADTARVYVTGAEVEQEKTYAVKFGTITQNGFYAGLTMRAFVDAVQVGQASAGQNQPAPGVAGFTLTPVGNVGGPQADATYSDNGEGIGYNSGFDNSAKRIEEDEVLEIGFGDYATTKVKVILGRADGVDDAVKVEFVRAGQVIGSTTVTDNVDNDLNNDTAFVVSHPVPFDAIRLSAGTATTRFAWRGVELTAATGYGNDVLNGGGGSDRIFGQGGDDTIDWDRADNPQVNDGDIASGGAGADKFLQTQNAAYNLPLGFGRITDFVPGTDKVRIKAQEVGLNVATATLVYGTTHQGNKIVVDTVTLPGTTVLRLPVGGTGKIFLTGTFLNLTVADFELF